MNYFANLRIQRIVIHEIFKRKEDGSIGPPRYNQTLTKLDALGLQTLQNRIVNALGDNSHSIEMDVVNTGNDSAFQLGASILSADESQFIDVSKTMAYKLAEAQSSRTMPGGIVLIFSGITGLNNHACWGIIKAEIQEGFVKENVSEALLLRYITDLLLTPQQRLYKLGIFIEIGNSDAVGTARSATDFKNFVYDHNITRNETQHAAYYFYRDFLGCSYSPTNKKLTLDFYNETKNFIKSCDLPSEDKQELGTALFTYMKVSQEQIVHVEEFADQYFPGVEVRQQYIDHMTGKAFPTHAVGKDLTYLKNRLRQRKVTFTSNVKIIAPADQFGELVQIQPDRANDRTTVIIKGQIDSDE
jgi:hypothetical protein